MADQSLTYERCIEAASISLASGDYVGAERSLRAAVQSIEGVGDSQLELATALNRLGALKQDIGSHAEAEGYFQRALEIGERALGTEHLGLVPALKGLGTTRLLQGVPQAAEPLLTRALAISERHLGEDHPDLVILLNDLTRLYLKQMAHGFAEPLLLRLLELKRCKGDDHPEVATVLASLATVRQSLGRHESAEQLWRKVLEIRERTLAPNHFALATTLEHLAETCAARGKLGEALGLYQRALTIREATLGRDHSSLRLSRERMADLELQASEESFDAVELPTSRVSPERARPSPSEFSGGGVVRATPDRGAPISSALVPAAERPVATRPIDHFVAPTAQGLAITSIKKAEPVSYMEVLQDIEQEFDADVREEPGGPARTAETVVAAVTAFVQKRRVATIVGVAAITLPLAAWGVAGAARSGEPRFVDNQAAAWPAQLEPRLAGAPAPDVTIAPGDSAARVVASKFDKGRQVDAAPAPISMPRVPTVPTLNIRVDSVRGVGAPVAPNSESVLRHLASTSLQATGAAPLAPVRARMIGALPTPRYPAQQLRARTSGEVRVRFDVDTTGRPVMSTFSVIATPHAQFASAVKEVIPGIRFEPARTPWPENRPMVETVELAFQFALPTNK